MNKSSEEMENDREWEERLAAMAQALPRENEPSRMLEERTVSALRTRGILQARRQPRINSGWLAGAGIEGGRRAVAPAPRRPKVIWLAPRSCDAARDGAHPRGR